MKKTLVVIIVLITVLFIYTKLDKSPSRESISQNLISWESDRQVFKYSDLNISYHDTKEASKEAIVLLHGYPTSSYDWHLIWPLLKGKYRLITFDMLGFGFSDKPKTTYSIELQTDILEALLQKLNVSQFHIIGHDYGDNVAQELLARLNDQKEDYLFDVQSLMLLNGGLFPETHNPTTIQYLLKSPFGKIVSSMGNSSVFENSFSNVFGKNTKPTKQELIDYWYLICQKNGHKINYKLVHASDDRERNKERWLKTLESPKIPILFINGLLDPVTGKETVDRYLELIPNPNVIQLDSIGHYPHLENPELVVEQINLFQK